MKKIISLLIMSLLLVSCGNKKGEGPTQSGNGVTSYPPRQITYPLSAYTFSNQVVISSIHPTYYGGVATSFSISPALPEGLHFSEISGRIAGTPEDEIPLTVFTVTATNQYGSVSTPISLRVIAQQPFGLRYVSDSVELSKNTSNISLLPEANSGTRGGAAISSYSISPATLPTGIVFNSVNGYIEGTPTQTFPPTLYTITGSNTAGSVSTTMTISVTTTYSQLTAGGKHNCVLDDNVPYCWGDNVYGQLGNGNNTSSGTKQLVTGVPENIRNITLGSEYSCMINNSFDVYCFGRNQSGQLGSNIIGNKNSGTLFSALGKMSRIFATKDMYGAASTNYHTCGNGLLQPDLYCWGSYDFGNLSANGYIPKFAGTLLNVPAVNTLSQGSDFTCFILDGKVSCFGNNSLGQLGDNQVSGLSSTNAVSVSDLTSGVFLLTSGNSFSCALKDEVISCWGDNSQKQLGRASYLGSDSKTPILVENMPSGSVSDIKAGKDFACALVNSKVYCWGSNGLGQLGMGTTGAPVASPSVVLKSDDSELSGVTSLSIGENHACALVSNKIYCWGDNSSNQVNNSATAVFSKATEIQ